LRFAIEMKIVIAGGGLAGAAAAAELSRAGAEVTLYEREAGPVHKICGEFLSTEAQGSLRRIGLDVAALGGHRINRLVMVRGARKVETSLPFEGLGVTRKVLDEALLVHAAACGVLVERGRAVGAVETRDGLSFDVAGDTVRPETLLLATGKHEVRGLQRIAPVPLDLVGFKMYFQLTGRNAMKLAHKIALILFQDGYAGLQMVEGGAANLCLLVSRARLQRLEGKWPALLAALCGESVYLADILEGAVETLAQPLSIYRVPYGFIHRPVAHDPPALFRLGDQAAVIPSFTGDGMAIALHSAALAVKCIQAGETAASYHQRLAGDVAGQIWRAGWLYRAVSAPAIQRPAFAFMQAFPASLRMAAALTRVPVKARVS
jgi:flavin-dependent dehydrogenase